MARGMHRSMHPGDVIGLRAVNVGVPSVLAEVNGERVWRGIAKQPVAADRTLWLSHVNLSGDGQADLTVHGGVDKAVYSYPYEHVLAWEAEFGSDLGTAPFGENLSTTGVLEADVCIGDVWTWGTAVMQVAQPRWPCFKLALYRQLPHIQKALRSTGRTGWYFRVLDPGEVALGLPMTLDERDPQAVTVADAHLAMADVHLEDRARVTAVADHPALAAQWRQPLVERLARH